MKRFTAIAMLCLLVAGCFSSRLNLLISFDRADGLKAGDRVLFQDNQAGEVEKLTYTDKADYLVEISIAKDFTAAATEHTRFFIIPDPDNAGQKAIKMTPVREGGKALADGTTVKGSTQTGALFEALKQQVNQGTDDVNAFIEQLSKEISEIPESDAYQQLESQLNQLGDEMAASGEEVRRTIKEEILPQVEEALEKLKEQLKEQGREEEAAPLESKVEEIREM